jgi:DnaJ-class molecular chaperone
MPSTHYDTLGVSSDANEHEIKKAYRALSLKYHPDRNPSAEAAEKIREINDAYETLSDAAKRKQYDNEQRFGGGGNPFAMGGDDPHDISQLFSMIFGQGFAGQGFAGQGFPGQGFPGQQTFTSRTFMPGINRMHTSSSGPEIRIFHGGVPGGMEFGQHPMFANHPMFRPQKPQPIVLNMVITMTQAYTGCTLPVEVERWVMIGDVKIQEEETLYVQVPPGIDDNEMIIIKEKGNAASDDCKGDVKITVELKNDTLFKRQGLDLLLRKKITLKEALCGFEFDISHINGKTLHLNNKTNSNVIKPNYRKTVAGLGMNRDGSTGHLIIEFDVEFPDVLSKEQIEAIDTIL